MALVATGGVPPNKAMETDGRFAPAAHREGVGQARTFPVSRPGTVARRIFRKQIAPSERHARDAAHLIGFIPRRRNEHSHQSFSKIRLSDTR